MPEKKRRIDFPIRLHQEVKPYLEEVGTAFEALYPLATAENSILSQARRGDLHFFSLDVLRREKNNVLQGIDLALQLAADETRPTYSSHGVFRHKTFHEVIHVFREYIYKSPQQLQLSVSSRIIEDVLQPSFILETPDYLRKTARPQPLSWVMQLARIHKDIPPDTLYKRLREVTTERGIGFGIMASIYAGVHEHQILKHIFQNKDLARNLRAKDWDAIPTENRPGDFQLINELWKTLMVRDQGIIHPSFQPESYERALAIAKLAKWIPQQQDLQQWYYQFAESEDLVKALTVFQSARHVLSDILLTKQYPKETIKLLQPAIDQEYGSVMTSRVKTGYFIFKNYRNLWTP